jgi:dihydroorotase
VVQLLESFEALDRLDGFVSTFGRKFYGKEISPSRTVLLRKTEESSQIAEKYVLGDDSVVPFWAGRKIAWVIVEE